MIKERLSHNIGLNNLDGRNKVQNETPLLIKQIFKKIKRGK